jgi:hypothetical protein
VTQLHTIVARQRGVATRVRDELTRLYHRAQHAESFLGRTRRFESDKEDVPSEAPETNVPPMTAERLIERVSKLLTESWDLAATRDRSNMDARADIVVGEDTLVSNVPVTTLMALEKQLVDLRTVFAAMPARDPAFEWVRAEGTTYFKTAPQEKVRPRKIVEGVVLYPHTERHPAQVKEASRDEIVGKTITVTFSGAMSLQEKESLIDRINELVDAVKEARTVANQVEVTDFRVAGPLLRHIFAR